MRFALTFAALVYLSAAFFQDWFLRPTCHCNVTGRAPATRLVDPATISRLEFHIRYLTSTLGERNDRNAPALKSAESYLQAEWLSSGYLPTRKISDPARPEPAALWVEKPGTDGSQIVVVTARLDSPLTSPGANATASGLASLVEISHRIQKLSLRRTVRFIALSGSNTQDEVARLLARDRSRVTAVVSLGSLGHFDDAAESQQFPPPQRWVYPKEGNFIQVLGYLNDERSRGLVNIATQNFSESTSIPVTCHKSWHTLRNSILPELAAFAEVGLPGIQISDTGSYRDALIGTAGDEPSRIDFSRLAETVVGITHVIEGIANDPGPSTLPHLS